MAVNRFWVGGSGTWDASDTTHWAAGSGGAGGQSVPGSTDAAIFDANSGGGTVTVNATLTVNAVTMGSFTGHLNLATNNNNVNFGTFSASGSGVRTLSMGNGIWTLTQTGTVWDISTTTNLTFNKNSSTIVLSAGATANRTFNGGALTYNDLTIGAPAGSQMVAFGNGPTTFGTITLSAPNSIQLPVTGTISASAIICNGSSGSYIALMSNTAGTQATLSVASGSPTLNWCVIKDMSFTGGATFVAQNSFDLMNNSGVTIVAPGPVGQLVSAQHGTPF